MALGFVEDFNELQTHTNFLEQFFRVERIDNYSFFVYFHGRRHTPYCGGIWKIRVSLTERYPRECPRIQFVDTIFHPNIDIMTGLLCPTTISLLWDPISSDVFHIFQEFLPWILCNPNILVTFLNEEAGRLWIEDERVYRRRVEEHCVVHANPYPRSSCCSLRMLLMIIAIMTSLVAVGLTLLGISR